MNPTTPRPGTALTPVAGDFARARSSAARSPFARRLNAAFSFTRRWLPFALCSVLVLFALPRAGAQVAAPGNGEIDGRVQNAATGNAIPNARVSIVGTNRFTTTDEAGRYYLGNVPVGTATVHVDAAGVDPQDATVTVGGGQTATQDFSMTNRAMYGENPVRLDAYVVQSTHETNAAAIAINEQRTNANITSVVAADEFGPRVDQNPGEFLKMLPGIDVQYFANNIVGISVRGLTSDQTEILFDGLPVASMNAEGISRGMEIQYASAADVSRVSIRKLPIPEDSANAIGGTVNFTRRSAFESDKLRVQYQAQVVSDAEHLTLQDMQGVKDRLTPRWKPNWTVGVTDPVTKNFGFALTVGQNIVDVNTHWSLPGWNIGSTANNQAAAAAIAAGQPVPNVPSVFNPAMQNPLNHDAPKMQGKDFATLRVDWRPFPSLTLNGTLAGVRGWVQNADDIRYQWNAAATGSGDVTRYNDPHTSLGRPGGGEIWHNSPLWRDVYAPTVFAALEAVWRKGDWEAGAKLGLSEARYDYHDTEDGFFNSTSVGNVTGLVNVPETGVGFGTANPIELTVDYRNIDYWGPKTIQAWTTARGAAGLYSGIPGTPAIDTNIADYTVPVNWQSNDMTKLGGARSRPGRGRELLAAQKSYLKRYFNFENPLSIQLGFDWSQRYRARTYPYYTWRFVGPNASTTQISAIHLRPQTDFEYKYPGSQRISLTRYYKMYQDHPEWFRYDAARSAILSATNAPDYALWEKIAAPYAEFEWHLLKNRLTIVGGVRYERVMDNALGERTNADAAYMHYANGQVVRAGDLDANKNLMVQNFGSPATGTTPAVVNYQLVNAPTVLPTTVAGAPVFLPIIQQAGNAQVAAGESTDTGTNVGRASLAYANLVYQRYGSSGHRMNDGYFPSINASYNINENLVFQFGYARTQARIDYANVLIPGTTIDDSLVTSGAGAGAIGRITLHNQDLKPWRADNFDVRLTWYNQSGGYVGIGAFTKRVKNIIASFDSPPMSAQDIAAFNAQYPSLNLTPDLVGFSLHTDLNAGNGREDGAEVEVRQSLDPYIGRWVPGFRIYATSTYTNPSGPQSTIFNDIRWHNKVGLEYSRRRFSANVNWTMIGQQVDNPNLTNSALPGVTGTQVELKQNMVDVTASYAVTRWARVLVGATNITDERRAREQRFPSRPATGSMTSSNTFGKTYFIGVSGNF